MFSGQTAKEQSQQAEPGEGRRTTCNVENKFRSLFLGCYYFLCLIPFVVDDLEAIFRFAIAAPPAAALELFISLQQLRNVRQTRSIIYFPFEKKFPTINFHPLAPAFEMCLYAQES